jgi:hypothetical protein
MPLYVLLPSNVWFNNSQGSDPDVWKDEDDGTFVTITQTGATPTLVSRAYAWVETYTGPIVASEIRVCARVKAETSLVTPTVPLGAEVVFNIPGGGSTIPFTDAQWLSLTVPNDGEWHDVVQPLTAEDYDWINLTNLDVLTRLAGGTPPTTGIGLRALRFTCVPSGQVGSGVRTFYISEAWIEIGRDGIPPRRIFGRSDGLTHGAARVLGGGNTVQSGRRTGTAGGGIL